MQLPTKRRINPLAFALRTAIGHLNGKTIEAMLEEEVARINAQHPCQHCHTGQYEHYAETLTGDELQLCDRCFEALYDAGQLACEHCGEAPATCFAEYEINPYVCADCYAEARKDSIYE